MQNVFTFFILKIISYGKSTSFCDTWWNKIGVFSIICNVTQINVFTRHLEIRKHLIRLSISLISIFDTFFLPKYITTEHKDPNAFLIWLQLDNNQRPNNLLLFMKMWFKNKFTKAPKHQVLWNLPSKAVIFFSQPNKFKLSGNRLISSFWNVILLFANLMIQRCWKCYHSSSRVHFMFWQKIMLSLARKVLNIQKQGLE